jgi:hypothetical protein
VARPRRANTSTTTPGGGSPCHANTPAGGLRKQLAPTGALTRLYPST